MRGRKKSEQTRLTILRAAAEVFSQRPFHQVLTDHLSTHLRMGKGTLYRYFASKEELYFAAIVHGLEGLRGAIDAVLRKNAPLDRAIETLARTTIRREAPSPASPAGEGWGKGSRDCVDLLDG